MQGLTPYIRWGNVPVLIGSLLVLLVAARARRARG
jgi:apolipoprotein N-acyltransferase